VQERSDFRDREESTYFRYGRAARQRWQKQFETLISQGRMRRMPIDQAINILSDLLYGTIFMNHFRGPHLRPEGQAAEVLEVLFGGLLTETEFCARSNKSPGYQLTELGSEL
jgi:hypothetical protein